MMMTDFGKFKYFLSSVHILFTSNSYNEAKRNDTEAMPMNDYENNEFVPEQEQPPVSEPPRQETPVQQEVPPQQPYGGQASSYHGAGAGRKESPYANSPYVVNHQPRQESRWQQPEPQAAYQYPPQYEAPKAPKVKKQHKGLGKKILAAVLALVVVAGS